jgi:hypothetical protein
VGWPCRRAAACGSARCGRHRPELRRSPSQLSRVVGEREGPLGSNRTGRGCRGWRGKPNTYFVGAGEGRERPGASGGATAAPWSVRKREDVCARACRERGGGPIRTQLDLA